MPNLRALKIFRSIKLYNTKNKFLKTSLDVLYLLKYAGTTTKLQIILNNQNNPFLNQATQQILDNISY